MEKSLNFSSSISGELPEQYLMGELVDSLKFEFEEDRFREFDTIDNPKDTSLARFASVINSSLGKDVEKNDEVVLVVEGHTDDRITREYASNYQLSYLRSLYLTEWLFKAEEELIPLIQNKTWADFLESIKIVTKAYGSKHRNEKIGFIKLYTLEHKINRSLWVYFYFSFCTITTNSYGDIQPVDSITRLYVVLENFFEVYFIGILLSIAIRSKSTKIRTETEKALERIEDHLNSMREKWEI